MAMDTIQVGFRMPTVLMQAIDEHVEWVHTHRPHQRYTRTDAVRELIALGVETAKERQKRSKKGS